MIPWTAAHQASLSFTISQSLLKLISIESVMLSNYLILCHPLLLPSIFPSIRVFFNSALPIRWPEYWRFSFSICPSSEHSGLISFRIYWFDLLAAWNNKYSFRHQFLGVTNLDYLSYLGEYGSGLLGYRCWLTSPRTLMRPGGSAFKLIKVVIARGFSSFLSS